MLMNLLHVNELFAYSDISYMNDDIAHLVFVSKNCLKLSCEEYVIFDSSYITKPLQQFDKSFER